ncbi:MAG: GGDEF domain-containing protein [Treponema sp.]|jgi:diguanylate cyclase (GGDEF)-like protein|nr:GGDEF domain-containing protein [Treponema sp.]
MEIDLFEYEQRIHNEAAAHVAGHKESGGNALLNFEEYAKLAAEYGRLLKHLRRSTRIADRTTTGLNESNLDLEDKVHYDALTGIYNRRFMDDNLKRIIRSLSRSGSILSVMMTDIDYFKKYNDTYGHSEGDACLKTVAQTLAGSLSRSDDFVARYGGEEFAVILPNTDESNTHVMANRILENIRARNIPHEKNKAAGCVTISIGITTGLVTNTQSGIDYIKRADEALYQSKRSGRNRYTYISLEEKE